jgi:hypothetical protein
MKNNPSLFLRLRLAAAFCGALILLGILTGCESISSYSVQSYQGPAPVTDRYMIETGR